MNAVEPVQTIIDRLARECEAAAARLEKLVPSRSP
jgi:hypothetical protein